jgi:Pyruvate/2-oxoacid:ferredoxin oxidoreductase delta subunit
MSRHRLTVILSQAQGKNPAKRGLEESIVAALIMEPGLDVSVVPHLYDLHAEHTGRLFLESVKGDMVMLSWLYPRACFWLLDRDGIQGQEGLTQLRPAAETDEDEEEVEPPRGIGAVNPPDRHIYCLDLRDSNQHEAYLTEIRRIAAECQARAEARQRERAAAAKPMPVELGIGLLAGDAGSNGNGHPKPQENPAASAAPSAAATSFTPEQLLEAPGRRWYPVIDYSRCTNCMECLDFCLFGVYGTDSLDRIKVEIQDNCRKGCPACSRVCPEHAIMFPEYKTPAIAGAAVGGIDTLKIDLTKLFGGGDAMNIAALERDTELVAAGRQAVGMTVGIPKRQADRPQGQKDDLDKLMDSLDALDL